ncbi:probable LRR receptor-like serine/threonine-protein kinase At1g56130 [Magnolia sinica]|uniref:probable LRR receptor-like serine/threonine-protein kinase At1g56130 n=1 Tax=Magnolia sinica TaxID=86752 RepID=UPI0026591A91|nr:probable LRR receptor-like serine/threonine-protein kinase At1g56130 [Magnolia sinica]
MMKRSIPKSPSHTLLAACFWCLHLSCLVERCKVQAQTNFTTDPDEGRALNAIFQHWGLSVTSDDWNISGDPCSGTAVNSSTISDLGIKCDCQYNGGGTCHIIEMKVYNQGVQGAIPEELSSLISLTKLDLSYNNIEGSLPSFIGNFRHLRYLDISNNHFNGSLPPEIGTLPSLEYLDIRRAGFKGLLPPELGNLSRLQQLYISNNVFNGPLPPELGNLSSLQELWASYNQLTKIPNFIGNWNLTELDVSNNKITGPLPASIGNITSMLSLDVSENYMTGPLPPSIGNLKHLSYLDISSNNFSDSLPPELGNLTSLEKLDLSQNYITGPLPASIGNLMNLNSLDLSQNYITGPLPASIGNLKNLRDLSVSMNAISGSIPKELGNLRNLTSLDISSNNFSDSLPPELGNLSSLEKLYIDSCGLSGQIPSTFARLRNVNTLWASDNNFTGKIPDFIGSWALTDLRMQGNAFEGPIPSSFSKLTKMEYLLICDVSNGSSSLNFIENMTSLSTLVLRNNMLSGTVPFFIENHQSLKHMDLSFNNLSGTIPVSLFNMNSLEHLFLGNNSLSGTLPSQKSERLRNVDLSYNQLSGSFPRWVLDGGPNLTDDLVGPPKDEVTDCGLKRDDHSQGTWNLVANNFVFDSSNSRDWSLNCLQRSSSCYRNSQYHSSFAIRCGGPSMTINDTEYEGDYDPLGPVSYKVASTEKWAVSNVGSDTNKYRKIKDVPNTTDAWLFQYARISSGSLRYYGLGLENGNYTVNLKFAETEFPDSKTGKSVGKRVFDIYLQGNLAWKDFDIKKEAGIAFKGIEKKQWVMVHDHILEIHLLWAGKGTCCIPSPGTYGPAISAILVTPNFRTRQKNKIALAVEILASVVLSIVSVSLFLIWKRSKRLSVDEDEEFLRMGPRPITFSYRELKTATKDFSPANKLGQGGFGPVFKGTLLDGRIVAVKQLSVTSRQGKSQFLAEIAAISAVQHRNLVKLYGCCIKGTNRLLVYEYLENKSLDQALFGESNLHLDWHIRFEICLGTARGLAYLHEESRPRIVHRDVKASNILLDANLNPKISDFGLAKLYDDKMSHISTRVAGTIGYIAPEYAMRGHLTEKADIFGFGVVALEIVSGRPNPCENVYPENMYLVEWAWHLHENNRALELVDPRLSNFDAEEAARMIGIGLLCIQASPSLRPPMSRVVAMLQGDIEVSTVTSKPGYLTDLPPNFTSSFMSDGTLTASTSVTSSSQKLSPANESISPCEPLS